MVNVSSQAMTAYNRAKPQFHTYRTAEDILWYISILLVEHDDHTNGLGDRVHGSLSHATLLQVKISFFNGYSGDGESGSATNEAMTSA